MTDLFDLIAKGVFDPRGSTRAVILRRPDMRARLMIVGAAAFVQLSVITLSNLLGVEAAEAGPGGAQFYAMGLGVTFFAYFVTAFLAHRIGVRFGGTGARAEVATAVAWQNLLVAAISPLFALGMTQGALGGAASVIGVLLSFWYLGAAIAEAHGFRNTASVIAAMVAVIGVIGLVGGVVLSMLGLEGGGAP